jgi:LysM repeat protein
MDTISRENNSVFPLVGIGLGVVALAVAVVAFANISRLKTQLATDDAKLAQIPDDIASQVSAVSAKVDQVKSTSDSVTSETKQAFVDVGNAIGEIKADIAKLQESRHSGGRAAKGGGGPVVAGPGEYIVKSGDNLSRIARANGVSLSDLESVNPGVNSKHLKVGQKLKLPEKESAAPAPEPAPEPAPAPAPAAQ